MRQLSDLKYAQNVVDVFLDNSVSTTDYQITPFQCSLLNIIAQKISGKTCWAMKLDYLAMHSKMSLRSVKRCVRTLKDKKIINTRKVRLHKNDPMMLSFSLHPEFAIEVTELLKVELQEHELYEKSKKFISASVALCKVPDSHPIYKSDTNKSIKTKQRYNRESRKQCAVDKFINPDILFGKANKSNLKDNTDYIDNIDIPLPRFIKKSYIPSNFVPNDYHLMKSNEYEIDVYVELEKFKNNCLENNKKSANWNCTFTNWLITGHQNRMEWKNERRGKKEPKFYDDPGYQEAKALFDFPLYEPEQDANKNIEVV